MVYLNLADVLSTLEIIFDVLCIWLAQRLTRIAGGAPRAWYVIIAAFVVLLVWTSSQLIDDMSSVADIIDVGTAAISLVVVALFALGLFMLLRSFQRRIELIDESPISA